MRTVQLEKENRAMEQSIGEQEAKMDLIFGIMAEHARVNPAIAWQPEIQVGGRNLYNIGKSSLKMNAASKWS